MNLSTPVLPAALALSILLAAPSWSAPTDQSPGQGTLLTRTEEGEMLAVPLKHTQVRAAITGDLTQVEVTQTFHNPFARKIEAVYIFPLPDRAAVNHMEIRLHDRTIRGVVKTREAARQIYEDARARGRVAALLDQERPNIFTQSVANILSESEIIVRIRYHETVPYEKGVYTFTFPMVVGPRFTADVPDASRITPLVLAPGLRSGHDIALEVHLDAGATARDIASPSHPIEVQTDGRGGDVIRLKRDDSIPDRDFVLRYRLDGPAPNLIVLPHRTEATGYFRALIQPEAAPPSSRVAPKEMIFVVDCSGSMFGPPIEKVKEAMRHVLEHLSPLDTFQIIRFSNRAEGFAPVPVLATPGNLERARAYVEGLSGDGGTIMLGGVRTALSYPVDPDRLRIVAFMTDGFIGNEDEILAYVENHLGGARLYSFGVGDSVNRYLLDRMAEFGRGAVEYILLRGGVGGPVEQFYDRIRSPYLTDITLDWGDLQVTDVYPTRIPDLFLGRPVLLNGRYLRPGAGQVTLRARLGGQQFERRFTVQLPERHAGGSSIATLWARARIEDLARLQIRDPQPAREQESIAVALAHNLVSKHTSFVAVEEWIDTGPGDPVTVGVPVPLPPGINHEGFSEKVKIISSGAQGGFSTEFIDALPILGRNYQDVITLAPDTEEIGAGGVAGGTIGGVIGGVLGARDVDVTTLTDGASTATTRPQSVGHVVAPGELLCRLERARPAYRLGEPIEVVVTVENRSRQPLRLPATFSVMEGARFVILDEQGRLLTRPPGKVPPAKKVSVWPGGSTTLRITVNGPGGYTIDRAGTYRIVFLGSDLGLADSNILVLTVED